MPNLRTESTGSRGDQRWLVNTHGIEDAITASLPLSGFTKTTHYPDGFIPSGTAVDVANTKAVKPFADAEGAVLGFVLFDTPVYDGVERANTAVLIHGLIKTDNVPGEFAVPTVATGHGFTFAKGADS